MKTDATVAAGLRRLMAAMGGAPRGSATATDPARRRPPALFGGAKTAEAVQHAIGAMPGARPQGRGLISISHIARL